MTRRRRQQRTMEITITNNQRLIKINQQKVKKVLRKTLQYLKDSGKLNSLLATPHPPLPLKGGGLGRGCYSLLEVSILFVNDRKMRELNLCYRGKNKTTDVLSFPQQDSNKLQVTSNEKPDNSQHQSIKASKHQSIKASKTLTLGNSDTSLVTRHSLLPLGDIVISLPQAKRQAQENSKFKIQNSRSKIQNSKFKSKLVTRYSSLPLYEEVTKLLIHGFLHLLGYDHEKNKYQAKKMREMEEELLFYVSLF